MAGLHAKVAGKTPLAVWQSVANRGERHVATAEQLAAVLHAAAARLGRPLACAACACDLAGAQCALERAATGKPGGYMDVFDRAPLLLGLRASLVRSGIAPAALCAAPERAAAPEKWEAAGRLSLLGDGAALIVARAQAAAGRQRATPGAAVLSRDPSQDTGRARQFHRSARGRGKRGVPRTRQVHLGIPAAPSFTSAPRHTTLCISPLALLPLAAGASCDPRRSWRRA